MFRIRASNLSARSGRSISDGPPFWRAKRTATSASTSNTSGGLSNSGLQVAFELRRRRLIAGEDLCDLLIAQVAVDSLSKDVAEIRGEREITILVELFGRETWPLAVDLSAPDSSAHHEHRVGVAMIGTAIAVFFCGAAEFRHRDKHHVFHAIAEILIEGRE